MLLFPTNKKPYPHNCSFNKSGLKSALHFATSCKEKGQNCCVILTKNTLTLNYVSICHFKHISELKM